MLTASLPRLQSGLLTAAAIFLVLIGAYTAGSRAARRAEALKTERARTATTRKARETKQTIDTLDDDAVRSVARRWVRGTDK